MASLIGAMPEPDHVREATERAILRERVMLHALFAPRVAQALERYYSETMLLGMPTDGCRRDLAELLAERGLADPDGRAAVTSISTVTADHDIKAAYHLSDLARFRMSLDTFRAEYHRRQRASIRPVTPREVAQSMAQEAASAPPGRRRWRPLVIARRKRQKPS